MLKVQFQTESTCQISLLLGLYGQIASGPKSLPQLPYSSWQNVSNISCSNQQKSFCLIWHSESAPLKHFFFSFGSSCQPQVRSRHETNKLQAIQTISACWTRETTIAPGQTVMEKICRIQLTHVADTNCSSPCNISIRLPSTPETSHRSPFWHRRIENKLSSPTSLAREWGWGSPFNKTQG